MMKTSQSLKLQFIHTEATFLTWWIRPWNKHWKIASQIGKFTFWCTRKVAPVVGGGQVKNKKLLKRQSKESLGFQFFLPKSNLHPRGHFLTWNSNNSAKSLGTWPRFQWWKKWRSKISLDCAFNSCISQSEFRNI